MLALFRVSICKIEVVLVVVEHIVGCLIIQVQSHWWVIRSYSWYCAFPRSDCWTEKHCTVTTCNVRVCGECGTGQANQKATPKNPLLFLNPQWFTWINSIDCPPNNWRARTEKINAKVNFVVQVSADLCDMPPTEWCRKWSGVVQGNTKCVTNVDYFSCAMGYKQKCRPTCNWNVTDQILAVLSDSFVIYYLVKTNTRMFLHHIFNSLILILILIHVTHLYLYLYT